jgi:nucleoside-diphosphate-sugar epimerase
MNSIPNEKILVTGGGGFLGSAIVDQLIDEGYQVVTFQRKFYSELKDKNIEQRLGNLEVYADIEMALSGIDAVIHTAGKVGMNGTYSEFYNANFRGTKNLVEAMKHHKIKKLIYTSTPSVVFEKEDIINGDENLPYPKSYLTHYAATKKLAEEYVLHATTQDFWAISLRPHLIFGPKDQNIIPRIIEARQKNKLKIIGDGENLVDVIYVKNAAKAHLLGLKNINAKISGRAYFIGQGPVKLWEFTNDILMHFNLPIVTKKIPVKVAYAIGAMIEFILFITRQNNIHPPMSRFIALQLGKSHYFKHDRALNELGNFIEVDISEAIKSL